jgi:molecular chaperone GrpE
MDDETKGQPQADGASDPPGGDGSSASATDPTTAEPSSLEDGAARTIRDDFRRQLEEQRDRYLRLAAEYDNFRKRAVRERQDAGWRAQGDLVQGLVDVLDDIMRFAHVDPATTDATTLHEGVGMVERKILKTLGGHGLEVLNPLDLPFDPALHEAVGTEPALSPEDDHVVARVYQPGYVFRGQLLRPARVVVRQWNG